MPIYYSQLRKELESGKVHPAYLLSGTEVYLMDQIIDLITTSFVGKAQKELNYFLRYASDTSLDELQSLTAGGGLFSEKKVVVYRDYQDLRNPTLDGLINYLKNPDDAICLVLVARTNTTTQAKFKKLDPLLTFASILPLRERELDTFINSEFKKYQKTISPEAVQSLLYLVGDQINSLQNQIVQIASNYPDRDQINVEEVEKVVGVYVTQNVFQLVRSIVDKKIESSFFVLHNLLEKGESPHTVLALLLRHFQILWKIHGFYMSGIKNNRTIQEKLRIYPKHFSEYIRDLKVWKAPQLREALQLVHETDRILKSSQTRPEVILDRLLIQLAYLK